MSQPIIFNGIVLEDVCPECNGNPPPKSLLFGLIDDVWCDKCGRRGCVLNKNGKQICELVKNYLTTSEGSIKWWDHP